MHSRILTIEGLMNGTERAARQIGEMVKPLGDIYFRHREVLCCTHAREQQANGWVVPKVGLDSFCAKNVNKLGTKPPPLIRYESNSLKEIKNETLLVHIACVRAGHSVH